MLLGGFLVALAAGANVDVDVGQQRHSISPLIYGANGPDVQLQRMGATLRRFGGNRASRYNYLTGTTNLGGDGLYFRSVPVDAGIPFGMSMIVELPLLGFVSKGETGCGFSVTKYGAQSSVSPLDADCGDGFLPDGGRLTGNDPLDTSVAVDAGFVRGYLDYLRDAGVRYLQLGNQPALWSSTHVDVHPSPASYAEIRARFVEASNLVKQADPALKTLGPSEWGWINYFDSAASDRGATGVDFIPYYLNEARLQGVTSGRRTLDYLDLHVYPQAAAPDTLRIVRGDISPDGGQLRLRSTRSLWDPTYAAEGWESCCFGGVLNIIPRMRNWVDAGYPGTGISISEYSWGALDDITGALAEADVLGIFGREGLDLAVLDQPIPDGAIGEDAFKLYASFGTTSVKARSDDLNVASFAAVEGNRVRVVLINKSYALTQQVDLTLEGGLPATGSWSASGFSSSQRLQATAAGTYLGGTLTRVLGPLSAEVLELLPDAWDGGFVVPVVDAGTDAGVVDAGSDAGVADAGSDAGVPDAGSDAGVDEDAGVDAGRGDSGVADAGGGGGKGGCGCNGGGEALIAAALLVALRRRRRSTLADFGRLFAIKRRSARRGL